MQTLLKSEIPDYLKAGKRYHTLLEKSDDPNEEVSFPANALKPDMSVNSDEDCEDLLNSLCFWGVETSPAPELLSHVLFECDDRLAATLEKYRSNYSWVGWLKETATEHPDNRWKKAVESQLPELVQALFALGFEFPRRESIECAVIAGNIEVLELLRKNGLLVDDYQYTGRMAIDHGRADMLKYFLDFEKQARSGDMHFLVQQALRSGQLSCLKVLCESRFVVLTPYFCEMAACGHLDCLQYLHEIGCRWHEYTTKSAAESGSLDCLQYAHMNGCPWDKTTCEAAALKGHLACLQYAYAQGCPWDKITCRSAAEGGNLECLRYAHENGCPWDEETTRWAASFGELECMQYAHENGCPLTITSKEIKRKNPCWKYVEHAMKKRKLEENEN